MQSQNAAATSVKKSMTISQMGLGVVVYAVILGAVVALIAGYFEISFRLLAGFWFQIIDFLDFIPRWLLFGLGTFIACPILYYILLQIPERRQHTPADIVAGIHLDNGNIDAKSSLLSVLAAIFSLGFGFSVGYYGPTVQLGAGAGFLLHRFKWISPAYYYISIGAGVAAAIASIFQAPIGAVVFVHEVLLRFFSVRAFAPITIAAVTSYIVSNHFFDKAIFFDISSHYQPETTTYFVAAFAGVLAAIIGVLMIRMIIGLQNSVNNSQLGLFRQLLVGAALTSLIIIAVPEAAGNNLTAIDNVLSGTAFSLLALIAIFFAKLFATTIAFGFGVPGGIFGPTIFVGAALGGLIAGIVELAFPSLVSADQIIIITTMAAMISAVLGAPIAMVLIVVEITGDFGIISVVMLAVVMSNITAYRFMGTSSFYDIILKLRGFDFELGRDRVYAENHYVNDLVSDDYLALKLSLDMITAEKQMLAAKRNVAFVTDDEGKLLGQVRLVDIEYYRREKALTDKSADDLSHVIHKELTVIYPGTSVWEALEIIGHEKKYYLPVVDSEVNPKLLGVVHNSSLIERYMAYNKRLRTQESAV